MARIAGVDIAKITGKLIVTYFMVLVNFGEILSIIAVLASIQTHAIRDLSEDEVVKIRGLDANTK
ncbi:MAG: hypothetical protein ACLRS3_02825 [Veillonella parvula]